MKFIPKSTPDEEPTNDITSRIDVLELTRRNLQALLDKLDDPASNRTLIVGSGEIAVRAVEDDEHYKTRQPGAIYMPTSGEIR